MEIKYNIELDDKFRKIPITKCPNKKHNYVASTACVHLCEHFRTINERENIVVCGFKKESK